MNEYYLSEIIVYPVKSLSGISLSRSEVTPRGLMCDRRWMLVDENGKFITQRHFAQMSQVNVEFENGHLRFSHKQNNQISFSVTAHQSNNKQFDVVVWNDIVKAEHVNTEADDWFSEILNVKCRLVYMTDESIRFVDKRYAANKEIVGFADAYPFLLIGQSSLDDLNTRLAEKVKMNRFRPNLVFTGGDPFDEDKMKSFEINGIVFYPVKPCSRCVVTTVDQETGIKGKEPLTTLSSYRTVNNKIMFGQNLLHNGIGVIETGMQLKNIQGK